MKIAILGTGMVGQALATALAAKGHEVTIGTRDVEKSRASSQPNAYGMPAFGTWYAGQRAIGLATFADAVVGADLVINASNGATSLKTLELANLDQAGDVILWDIANDLDFSKGMPPASAISDKNGAGLAERIQARFPNLRVVKTLSSMNAAIMLNPSLVANGDSTVFVSGNDADAKNTTIEVLTSFGWTDILDLGDIATSRSVELLMPVWMALYGVLGNTPFNFKIAR